MREIEFRAWQKYHKKMLEVFSIRFADNETRRVVEIGTVSPQGAIPKYIYYHESSKDFRLFDENNEPILTLMQYTGLKDKNGTKIYEGDIIQLVNEDNETVKAVCKFGNRRLTTIYGSTIDVQCYYFQIGDRKTNPVAVNYMGVHDLDIVEVIGNLYENPELLEN